jgi:hypothetical protein
MKYQYVQLIAYRTPTLNWTGFLPAPSQILHEKVRNLTNYLQEPKKVADEAQKMADDAQNRVHRMLDVLHWAVSSIPGNVMGHMEGQSPNPLATVKTSTLKVFIAPEFYFRPTQEGYSWNTMLNILECLKASLTDLRFDDWLIVPGTIFSNQLPKTDPGVFFNTASIIKGGTNSSITFVHKEHKSGLDKAPINFAEGTLDPRFTPIVGTWAEQKERLFNFEDITFGLDVCLDHANKALKRTIIQWPQNENGAPAPNVDVHIVTSCGIQVETDRVAARTGGCVLLCDGVTNPDPWLGTAVYKVEGQGTGGLDQQALLTRKSEVWREAIPENLTLKRHTSATNWFEPEVVVYEPVKLF